MKKHINIMVIICLVAGCTRPSGWSSSISNYREIKGAQFKMEIAKIDKETDDNSVNLKIRLYPGRQWLEKDGNKNKVRLVYGMDSCFSLSCGGKPISPSLFQPVNNGISNCFEYLVCFEPSAKLSSKAVLWYQDKFISGKNYMVSLNN